MLNIRYEHIDKVGTCNLCSRGTLQKKGIGMDFPYNHVFVIRGDGNLEIRMCRKCIKEIKEEI